MIESTGWTWDYLRSLKMPRLWKLMRAMAKDAKRGADGDGESGPKPGWREVKAASFGG